ncbi:hypothetical protein PBI_SPORTO_53 [Arthrobacter phage Sporto]|nr:hypothetical protein PBI_SPORTO_53 [Arthrobacter phage Sporto]
MSLSVFSSIKNINSVGRAGAVAQKFSPQILTAVGVVGVVAAGVLAAKATLRLEDVVDVAKADMDAVNEKKSTLTAEEYSSAAHKRDVTKVYFKTAKNLGKLYGLPIFLGTVSISCIIGGQGIQYKRTVGAVAAYKTLEETFEKYRSRVVAEFGEEKDQEFRSSYKVHEETDAEGNITATLHGNFSDQDWTAVYDHNNPNWKNSPDYNLMFVKAQETYANQMLSARGHVLLNDVLDGLGMQRTHEGALVGWVLDKDGPNFIDFGITDLQNKQASYLGTDEELGDCILLDFNVQGIIWDKF